MVHPINDKEREILTKLISDAGFQQAVARDPVGTFMAEGLTRDDAENLVRELAGGDEVSGYKLTPDANALVKALVKGAEALVRDPSQKVLPDEGLVRDPSQKVLPDDGRVTP